MVGRRRGQVQSCACLCPCGRHTRTTMSTAASSRRPDVFGRRTLQHGGALSLRVGEGDADVAPGERDGRAAGLAARGGAVGAVCHGVAVGALHVHGYGLDCRELHNVVSMGLVAVGFVFLGVRLLWERGPAERRMSAMADMRRRC
jgi:hypothetical protein